MPKTVAMVYSHSSIVNFTYHTLPELSCLSCAFSKLEMTRSHYLRILSGGSLNR